VRERDLPALPDRLDLARTCLLAQLRPALEVSGPLARKWIEIAQAFAGPPPK
jgi:hypothetical protein